MVNDIIKVYGIYIILIVALAGLSILLFDANSPISLFGDKGTVSKCSPDDPSCVSGTPSIASGTKAKTSPGSSISTSGKAKNAGNYSTKEAPLPITNGLELLLQADSINLNNGDEVFAWNDLSGNGNDMGISGEYSAPKYYNNIINGHAVVHVSYYETIKTSTNFPSPVTVIYLSRQTGPTYERLLSGVNNNWLLGYWEGLMQQAYFQGWVGNGESGPLSDTNWHIYSGIIGSTSRVYDNGVEFTTDPNGGVEGPNGLKLNCGNGECGDGDIAEIIVYNRALNDNERKTVECYLSDKYNLGMASCSGGSLETPTLSPTSGYINNTLECTVPASGIESANFNWYVNGVFAMTTAGQCAGGSTGSSVPQGATGISTCQELQDMQSNLSGYYVLTKDIDCTGFDYCNDECWSFYPIGTDGNPFTGTFDGQNHTITGLYINRPSQDYVGLFGYASGASISNVGLINMNITGSNQVGGLIGYSGYSTISGSYSTGSVTGTDWVGGLLGEESYSNVSNSYSAANVNGLAMVGGLLGYSHYNNISNSYSTGNVTGGSYIGGLIGQSDYDSVYNTYSTGSATGSEEVGGLIGQWNEGSIYNSYWNNNQESCTGNAGNPSGCNWADSASDFYSKTYDVYDTNSPLWDFTNIWQENSNDYPTLRSFFGQSGSYCHSAIAPFSCGNFTCEAVANDQTSPRSNIATIFNSPVKITDVAFNATTIKEGESVSASINLTDLECSGENCQVSVSVRKPGSSIWEEISSTFITWANELGRWVATIFTQIGQGWVGLVSIQINATDECSFSNGYGYGYCTCQDYGYGYDGGCGDSKDYTINVTEQSQPGVSLGTPALIPTLGDMGSTLNCTVLASGVQSVDFNWYLNGELSMTTAGQCAAGGGSSSVPPGATGISTCQELQDMQNNLSGHYVLTKDIDCTGFDYCDDGCYNFYPIGTDGNPFTGTFDGQNHTITGLYINRPSQDYAGLFGYASGASISNVGLVDVNITGGTSVGGLVGKSWSATISNSYATGAVSGSSQVGGLIGSILYGSISNSYATDTVSSSTFYVGGLIGNSFYNTVSNSYATGTVTGGFSFVGGLIGESAYDTVSNSYATGNVTGSSYVGGLLGYSAVLSTVSNSYATGTVSGSSRVGGLAGQIDSGGSISNSYWYNNMGVCCGPESSGSCDCIDAASASDFFSKTYDVYDTNAPLWDFETIWQENADNYPTLRSSFGQSGTYCSSTLAPSGCGNYTCEATTGGGSTGSSVPQGATGISTCQQLQDIRNNPFGYYVLTKDIDCKGFAYDLDDAGSGFMPIGTLENMFRGTFDGQNHTITGLYINRPEIPEGVGLFGWIGTGSVVKNVGLINVTITGQTFVGGLIGENWQGSVTNCFVTGSVTGTNQMVGGLMGINYASSSVSNSYSTAAVTGTDRTVGGLLGFNYGSVTDSYATGNVNLNGYNAGGLIGANQGSVTNCFATGTVTGNSVVGGLVGWNVNDNVGITNSYWYSGDGASQCCGSGSCSDCHVQSSISYFYSAGNAPMQGNWDFSSIWHENANNYPTLKASAITITSPMSNIGAIAGCQAEVSLGTPALIPTLGDMGSTLNCTVLASGVQSVDFNWYLNGELSMTTTGQCAAGGGSSSVPEGAIEISTCQELQDMQNNLSGHYVLTKDLDCTGFDYCNDECWSFYPIGTDGNPFTGTFDGQNHTITGLYINRPSQDYVGLFGYVNGASISNVGLENVDITGQGLEGGLAGKSQNTIFNNDYTTGSVSGSSSAVGGLIGFSSSDNISNSYSTGNVNNTDYETGGLIGFSSSDNISNSYSTGNVTGDSYVGGLISMGFGNNILNSYSTGSVAGSYAVGGIIGQSYSSTISNSYATGSIFSSCCSGGGLIGGSNSDNISNSYATGNVSGSSNVGGLIGSISYSNIYNSYWNNNQESCIGNSGTPPGCYQASSTSDLFSKTYDVYDTNAPLWDFANIWIEHANGYPTLKPVEIPGGQSQVSCSSTLAPSDCGDYTCEAVAAAPQNDVPSGVPQGATGISTCQGLQDMQNDLEGYYVLTEDIDCTGFAYDLDDESSGFMPIGFTGTFDGQNHTISNLYINRPSMDHVGLFGSTSGASIRNVGLVNVSIIGADQVGGLIGYSTSGTEVSNSYSTGNVTGTANEVGGLVGTVFSNSISNSYSTVSVRGDRSVGGLIGAAASNDIISNSYASGNVNGGSWTGGLIGYSGSGTTISNSFSTGNVTGTANDVGGLIGNSTSIISNSYWYNNMGACCGTGECEDCHQAASASYFYSAGNAPMQGNWDFATIWRGNANNYPTFKSSATITSPMSNIGTIAGCQGGAYLGTPTLSPASGYINNTLECAVPVSGIESADFNWYLNGELSMTTTGQCGDGSCSSTIEPFSCGNYTCDVLANDITSPMSNTATIFNSPVKISEVTFSKNPIKEGEAVIVGINLTDLECNGGDCQVSISVKKPGQSTWEILNSNLITWIEEIGRWVATISTQIGQGWVGLVSVQINATDECRFCSSHGYGYGYDEICGHCTCQDYATNGYGYGYDTPCGDSKTYQFTVSKSSQPTPNPPSTIPEELLPLNILIDSISCQSDGTGDVTVKAWDFKDRPLQGVLISIDGQSRTTGADGMATFMGLGKGDYSLTSSLAGYETTIVGFAVSCQKKEVTIPPQPPAGEAMGNLSIIVLETGYNADGTANVKLLVRDYYNHSVSGAAVTISGSDIIYYTDENGIVIISRLRNGEYTATVSKNGYSSDRASFTIKFEVKKEPAGQPTQNPISEAEKIIYSMPCVPIAVILAILILLFALWRRKKKKDEEHQADEQSIKPEPEGPKPQDPVK